MAFSTTASRFAFLTDDAADPFEKKKKKAAASANPKVGKGAVAANKTKPKKTTTNNSTKIVTGSQQQMQRNKAKSSIVTNHLLNNNTAAGRSEKDSSDKELGNHEEFPEIGSSRMVSHSDKVEIVSEVENVAVKKKSKKNKKAPVDQPKEDQWEEWQKRDQEFVTGSFESDLEAALMQSKIDYQGDAGEKAAAAKRKTKNKSVSLADFNQMINGQPGILHPGLTGNVNGLMPPPGLARPSADSDEALMEQFRLETKLEMERERRLELERQKNALKAKSLVPTAKQGTKEEPMTYMNSNKQNHGVSCSDPDHLAQTKLLLEKQESIDQLSKEKSDLEKELSDLRVKFRKICSMLADAQLKDKAILLRDTEKLTQLNTDLNEQVLLLHSQLEQEKSKCSSVSAELRKANEQTRKRTQSHNENQ